jgi:hypothetical protein
MAIGGHLYLLALDTDRIPNGLLGLKHQSTVNRHTAFFTKKIYLVYQQLICLRTVSQSIRIPAENVHDLIEGRILRNLSLPEIIKIPKRNSESVATASCLDNSELLQHNYYATLCLAPNKVTISLLREKNYFHIKKTEFTAPILRK